METTLLHLTALMSGLAVLLGAGQLAGGTIASYEQLVIDCELFGVCKRFAKPIRVDARTMALETIGKVGPGGHFLAEDHTLRWMRDEDEYYHSSIFCCEGRAAERRGILGRVQEIVRDVLAGHRPEIPDREILRDFSQSKESELLARRS